MELIEFHVENQIATILLNNQPANALSLPVLKQLADGFEKFRMDDKVKVIVIRGSGRFFSAGADIKEFTTITSTDEFYKLGAYGRDLFTKIEQFPKPVIASIHGAALGGGLELAMACHIRFATPNTKLGLPEIQLGLIPGFAGTQRLPRLVGTAKAMEIMLSGEPIVGEEARNIGLVNNVISGNELEEYTYSFAKKIVSKSFHTIQYIVELLHYAMDGKFDEGMKKETDLFAKAFSSNDGKEGIRAFVEKRKPVFTDS